jgi:Glycyl-tRNA synthetase beta subunit
MQAGNESVLRARFEDAQFFFQEDLKRPLSDFRPQLSGITFHKSLGTMLDKSVRTAWPYLTWLFAAGGAYPLQTDHKDDLCIASGLLQGAPAPGCITFWPLVNPQERVERLVGPVGEAAGLAGAVQTAQQAAQLAHADLVNSIIGMLMVQRHFNMCASRCCIVRCPGCDDIVCGLTCRRQQQSWK